MLSDSPGTSNGGSIRTSAATLLGRQIGVERDIAVRADDAEPPVATEPGDQSLAFFRIGFAKRDTILRAHERLGDGRRPRIGHGPALGIVRADGFQIGPQDLADRRRRSRGQDARDPLAPFRRAPRLALRKIISARPGVSVDEAERRVLAREVNEDARQDGVLEDVGEIAGMKGMAIIHDRQTR